MLLKNIALIAASSAVLAACGSATQVANSEPTRMIQHTMNNHSYMWNYSDRFGAIPASEADRAMRECQKYKAGSVPAGYLPEALDINGTPIKGGVFSCEG